MGRDPGHHLCLSSSFRIRGGSIRFNPIGGSVEGLRSKLLRLSADACRMLLSGAVTLLVALGYDAAPEPCLDYVEAILAEVDHMPEDLRAQFVAGTVTMTQVRAEILRRHVVAERLSAESARLFSSYAIDLGTIAESVAGESSLT